MNIEDMIKNMNQQNLQAAIAKVGKMLTPEQLKQVQQTIQQTDKGEMKSKLNHLSQADFMRELQQNPKLAKQLASNPEVMKKINQLFGQK